MKQTDHWNIKNHCSWQAHNQLFCLPTNRFWIIPPFGNSRNCPGFPENRQPLFLTPCSTNI